MDTKILILCDDELKIGRVQKTFFCGAYARMRQCRSLNCCHLNWSGRHPTLEAYNHLKVGNVAQACQQAKFFKVLKKYLIKTAEFILQNRTLNGRTYAAAAEVGKI